MLQLTFTTTEIEQLDYERFHHPDPRVQRRMEIVYLKALGYAHYEIGRIARRSQKTVRRCLTLYRDGGLAALKANHAHRPTSALAAHQASVEAEFRAKPPKTLKEAQARLVTLTGIRRSLTQVRAFLRRLGFKRLKVAQIPAKADVTAQQTFLDTELEPRLEAARQGQRHVFFVDAAHFVLQPFLGFLWCLTRIFLQTPSGRQRHNVLGALHAISLQLVTVTNDTYINAESVAALLRLLVAQFADLPITVVLDNARYQHCKYILALAAELGIELLFLPPYSPNLNLIERLWKFVKQECLYSEYYATFADFKQAITTCLAEVSGQYKEQLATLLTLNFQTFENVTL